MCGIVAVLPGSVPPRAPDLPALAGALEAARVPVPTSEADAERALRHTEATLGTVNQLLSGPHAEQRLLSDRQLLPRLLTVAGRLERATGEAERQLDAIAAALEPAQLETVQRLLVRIADGLWALRHDRLDRIDAIRRFLGGAGTDAAIAPISAVTGYSAIETALRSLDRLEVRGRDSAGLHVWVRGPGLMRVARFARQELTDRRDPLLGDGAVEVTRSGLAFTYKTATITGQLGANVAALRTALTQDRLLARALHVPGARVTVLAHTRWASIGKISEPNACPVHQAIAGTVDEKRPYTVALLNGDIDNHQRLREAEDVQAPAEITTDAKLIPVLLARKAEGPDELLPAFSATIRSFAGSFALAVQTEQEPDALLLAVRGSGQGLYVARAPGSWVVASEPYGLVSETNRYLRIDGGHRADGTEPGSLVVLRRSGEAELALSRYHADGSESPIGVDEFTTAEITTRDIDRGSFPHYLLKELTQAPASVEKTLRGRIIVSGGRRRVRLGEGCLPEQTVAALRSGRIGRIVFAGQGTAAVACEGIAATAQRLLGTHVSVTAMPATELSAWHTEPGMADCLLVAVSQSGTTTDTNRAVDLARERGARVLSIVNRRNSDLVTKSDGVLYTSDGRDIEMAVASTKAFYSQIAAGILLALELRAVFEPVESDPEAEDLLAALEELPHQVGRLVNARAPFRAAARTLATRARHWAVVGSGPNRVAAAEVRIKLSELGYRSVSVDATEDKKHIDLSAESLIVVCAAGVDGTNADDIDKEVAIFAAHDNIPVVIASEGETRFRGIEHVLVVPETHPDLGWLLSVVAGHLFAYECAVAIDASAQPLRRALTLVRDNGMGVRDAIIEARPHLREFLARVDSGELDGCLSARHALRLARLTAAINSHVADKDSREFLTALLRGGLGDLDNTITAIIEELTRTVDAVRHQAKTVTVGTSRAALGERPPATAVGGAHR